jgi:hypothetical protein
MGKTWLVHFEDNLFNTSVGAKSILNELKVFPNPSKGSFIIAGNFTEAKISILDIYGKIILKRGKVSSNYEVSIPDVPPGIYFLQINQGATIERRKIIVE